MKFRFSILIALIMLLAACGGDNNDNSQYGDPDLTDGDIEDLLDADSDPEATEKESDKNSQIDGDMDEAQVDPDRDPDMVEVQPDADSDPDNIDGDLDPDTELEPDEDLTDIDEESNDPEEECFCDPNDPESCDPGFHCNWTCMYCEPDNPGDIDYGGDPDPDITQPDPDQDPDIVADPDQDPDPDIELNGQCATNDDCAYGSYCDTSIALHMCKVDCLDDSDCAGCCDEAIGQCGECVYDEEEAEEDEDIPQTHYCPGGQTSECPTGYYCNYNKVCDQDCNDANPCPDPFVCDDTGVCVIPPDGDEIKNSK